MRSMFFYLVLVIEAFLPARAADGVFGRSGPRRSKRACGHCHVPRFRRPRHGPCHRPRRPKPCPRLWRDREGQQPGAGRQQSLPPEFHHQGLTTEVLASLVAEGKLALTGPLQRYAHAKMPAFGTRPITLLDLATHTAALPREIGEAPPGVLMRAWPTREDRWKSLPSYKLPWARPAASPPIPMSASISSPMPSKPRAASPIPICCARHSTSRRTRGSRERLNSVPG
jgi:hypothetical protein